MFLKIIKFMSQQIYSLTAENINKPITLDLFSGKRKYEVRIDKFLLLIRSEYPLDSLHEVGVH